MYQRIVGLSESDKSLADAELPSLGKVWEDRRQELEGSGEFGEFIKKLTREWAIETGIIERLYQWDRGVTEVLIEQGIEAAVICHRAGVPRDRAESIASLIRDQLAIVDGIFSFVKGDQPLTEHYIRAMHQQFTAHQDTIEAQTRQGTIQVKLLKGAYKTLPNNPSRPDGTVHEYAPPEFVAEEMQTLMSLYGEMLGRVPTEVLAAWLHHRFTQIHPFQDGNGRVARALATLVFLKAGLFPLVIRDEADRKEYIAALEQADAGSLEGLVRLFARRQRDSLLRAIGLEQQVKQAKYADQIMASALQVLKDRVEHRQATIAEQLLAVGAKLVDRADERLRALQASLDSGLKQTPAIGGISYAARLEVARNGAKQAHYNRLQILGLAEQLHYYANTERYKAWLRLQILTESRFDYIVSIHGYGRGMTGIMAVSASTSKRFKREEGGGSDFTNLRPACTDLFQFNYAEPQDGVLKRFSDWLESSISIGLAEWKRSLEE